MRKPTIAELREREIPKLVSYKTNTPCEADFEEARHLMRSFYRLCGLCERNLYLTNSETTHDKPWVIASEEKEDRWWRRLDEQFNKLYGLHLVYCGFMPSIVKRCEHGGVAEKIYRYFYD